MPTESGPSNGTPVDGVPIDGTPADNEPVGGMPVDDAPADGMPDVELPNVEKPTPPNLGTPAVDWPVGRSVTASAAGQPGPSTEDRPESRSATALPANRSRPSIVDWPTATTDRSTARPLAGTRRVLVVVRPGDTLWSLASRRLGPGATAPAIAAEWRRWHAANQDVIGPDPRRLRTGVSLRVPGRP